MDECLCSASIVDDYGENQSSPISMQNYVEF